MNASLCTPARTRIAAFAAAVLVSATVLGATVLGMQSAAADAVGAVVALERVVVSVPAVH